MVKITEYDNGSIQFHCDKCDFLGEYDISSSLSDDCVFDVEAVCERCGDSNVVYILRCKTEYKAKELSAELEALKSRREG